MHCFTKHCLILSTVYLSVVLIFTVFSENKESYPDSNSNTSEEKKSSASDIQKDSSINPLLPDTQSVPDNINNRLYKTKKSIMESMPIVGYLIRFVKKYLKHCIILFISCLTIFLTVSFYRRKLDSKRFLTSTRLSIMDKEIQRACDFIEKHFNDLDLSVETICREMVTGAAFLEALFNNELGMSVSDFIRHVKVNRTKILLNKNPDISTEEIIQNIGFTDKDNLVKIFRDMTDVSLDEYRKSLSHTSKA